MSAALLTTCAAAGVSLATALVALRVGRDAAPQARSTGERFVLPFAMRCALRWARAMQLPRPIAASGRVRRGIQRQLARAGFREYCDAQTWLTLLVLVAVLGALVALLAVTWLRAPGLLVPLLAAGIPWLSHALLLGRARRRTSMLIRELPAGIDVLVLCLEAGASLGAALKIANERGGAGPVQDLLGEVLVHVRAGQPRAAALRRVMEHWDVTAVTALFTSLIQADTRGMSLGAALRAQSGQCVSDRFVNAERAAMQAPVKLLLPLLTCIFPCTFIVIAVPVAARFMEVSSP